MDIRNCKVKYRCPKTWDSLDATEESHIRYCGECDQNVHFCKNESELFQAIKNDWCVAIPIDSEGSSSIVEMGGIVPDSY